MEECGGGEAAASGDEAAATVLLSVSMDPAEPEQNMRSKIECGGGGEAAALKGAVDGCVPKPRVSASSSSREWRACGSRAAVMAGTVTEEIARVSPCKALRQSTGTEPLEAVVESSGCKPRVQAASDGTAGAVTGHSKLGLEVMLKMNCGIRR